MVMAPLGYHSMRMRHCRAALLEFLRRWSVYLVVGAAVLAVGGSAGGAALAAAVAWSVLPLFRAVSAGDGVVVTIALQATLGAWVVLGLRGMLWPKRWALAERALPISRPHVLGSDVVVVLWSLSPLFLVYAVGAGVWVGRDPAWLHGDRGLAFMALALVVAGSVASGVIGLHVLRREPGRNGRSRSAQRSLPGVRGHGPRTSAAPALSWPRAVVWMPLWRGAARRTGRALCVGTAALVTPAVATMVWPDAASWWLAGHAVIAMSVIGRLRSLSHAELEPLRVASLSLPIVQASMLRRRHGLITAPVWVSLGIFVFSLQPSLTRVPVFLLYAVACVACSAIVARAANADAVGVASRWLLCVVVLVAIASEVSL